MRASRWVVTGLAVIGAAVGLALSTGQIGAAPQKPPKLPKYEIDTSWPKPYPLAPHPDNGRPVPWITGEVAGTCIDSADHVFIVTRGNLVNSPETAVVPSPPVIEFDKEGNVVKAWGDRSVLPNGIHGCFVDYQDNIWIAGNGDGIVQKYSHDGALLLQIGTRGVCDSPPMATRAAIPAATRRPTRARRCLNQPADMWVDPNPDPVTGQRGSVYIADGYGNHRVVVFSANGTYLRQWGGVAGTVNNPAHRLRRRCSAQATAGIRTAWSAATTA